MAGSVALNPTENHSLMFAELIDGVDILLWKSVRGMFNNPAQLMMLNTHSIIMLQQAQFCMYSWVYVFVCAYLLLCVCMTVCERVCVFVSEILCLHLSFCLCVCVQTALPLTEATGSALHIKTSHQRPPRPRIFVSPLSIRDCVSQLLDTSCAPDMVFFFPVKRKTQTVVSLPSGRPCDSLTKK